MPETIDARRGGEDRDAPRRARRIAIPGVLVAIDAPSMSQEPWVADALDINAHGMGLVLPPEIPPAIDVLLTFKLGDHLEFSRVPARVQHREGTSGGVVFGTWPLAERLELLEYLVSYYESEP